MPGRSNATVCDGRDPVRAYRLLLESELAGTYNVCSGTARPLHELIETLDTATSPQIETLVDEGDCARPCPRWSTGPIGARPMQPGGRHSCRSTARLRRSLTTGASGSRDELRAAALITGITGQDGSYLAEFLLDKRYDVHGLVRRSSTENFQRLSGIRDRITLHSGDLLDQRSLVDVLRETRPDEVYNLAAMSFVAASLEPADADRGVDGCRRDQDAGGAARGLRPRTSRRRSTPAAPTAWRRLTGTSPSTTARATGSTPARGSSSTASHRAAGSSSSPARSPTARRRSSSVASASWRSEARRDWGYASETWTRCG